jgi:uncharacterized membrane protein
MAPVGRLHPLIVHSPIALVLIAAVAEVIATFSGWWRWGAVAVANVRAGDAFKARLLQRGMSEAMAQANVDMWVA